MKLKEISVTVPGSPNAAKLTGYIPDASPEIDLSIKRPAIVICPGGGYEFTSDREAEPIALAYLSYGFNAFVLRYHTKPVRYPVPQLELAAACALVKKTAEETHTDSDRVFVLGFSAGGHLAASLGILWKQENFAEQLDVSPEEIRPKAMVLCYPVITSGEKAHQGSFDALLGERRPELNDGLSLEKRVDESASPAFIWHTFDDDCVPVENSLMLAAALRAHDVSFEMHIFPHGPHGASLANSIVNGPHNQACNVQELEEWLALSVRFLKSIR